MPIMHAVLITFDYGIRRCHLHQSILNRDPRFFKEMEIIIDKFHKEKGHVNCNIDYDTRFYRGRIGNNSSLAEQKNAPLAELKNSFSHMGQVDFLFMLRFKLAGMNLHQVEKNRGSHRVFWRPQKPASV